MKHTEYPWYPGGPSAPVLPCIEKRQSKIRLKLFRLCNSPSVKIHMAILRLKRADSLFNLPHYHLFLEGPSLLQHHGRPWKEEITYWNGEDIIVRFWRQVFKLALNRELSRELSPHKIQLWDAMDRLRILPQGTDNIFATFFNLTTRLSPDFGVEHRPGTTLSSKNKTLSLHSLTLVRMRVFFNYLSKRDATSFYSQWNPYFLLVQLGRFLHLSLGNLLVQWIP